MKPEGQTPHISSLVVRLIALCLLISVLNLRTTSASYQLPDFYYYYTEMINLDMSTEIITVCFDETTSKDEKESLITGDPILQHVLDDKLPYGLLLIETKPGLNKPAIAQALGRLNTLPEIRYSAPVFNFRKLKLVLSDRFVVRFEADVTEGDIQALNEEKGAAVVRRSPYRHNRYVLRVINPKANNAIELANVYNEDPEVEYATPDFVVIGGYQAVSPDDTYFLSQWALDNTAQDPPAGTPDADMDAPEAWQIYTGSPGIVLAVLDTGVDIDHEDLASNMWTNDVELNGAPDVDDDNNGYVDDFYGWDFENDNNDPRGTEAHGTACAGLAAAQTNNGMGIAGVCWDSKIMPLRIGTAYPITSAAADAIDYASNNGADILSNSWGVPPNSDITDAIVSAKNNGRAGEGCVIIFAAGNDNGPVAYPASLDETITVGASDHQDERWDIEYDRGSNYGEELDVVAPAGWGGGQGVIFWTTDITGSAGDNWGSTALGDANGNYTKWFGGTSAAAPQVAGVAALILSRNPHFTADEVQSLIESTADDKGDSGWDPYYGWGRINAQTALLSSSSLTLSKDDGLDPNVTVQAGDYVTYTITYANPVTDANDPAYLGDVNDVNIVDYLPKEIDRFDVNASQGGQYDVFAGTVTWQIPTLSPGDQNSVTVTIKVSANAHPLGRLTNLAVLQSQHSRKTATKQTPVGCFGGDIIYVNAAASGDFETGTSWRNAYTDLQQALERAANGCGDQIWVAAGTYLPAVGDHDFDLVDGVYLYGGFAGDETSPNDRDWVTNRTILTGRGTTVAAVTASYLSDAIIDGFTVNNLLSQNGIAIDNGSLTVDNCTIQNNSSGINCGTGASLLARYCEILNNSTCGIESDGASSAVIENSWIHHNSDEGIFVWGMTSPLVLRNCTIADSYDYYGVFADALDSRKATISNCIIWGNDDGSLDPLGYYNVTYCCVEGGYSGTGNISSDPCFVPEANDYHLDSNSLCIDTADNNAVTDPNELDIDGEDRIIDGNSDGTATVDMGADEYYWSGADFNLDAFVNFLDFAIFATAWQTTSGQTGYNDHCDLEDNNAIDYNDLRVFCDDWLWQAGWTQPFGAGLARSMGARSGAAEGLRVSVSPPTAQPDVDELIKWLEDLWSRDKQLQEMFTQQEWQEFLKLVQQ
jgi:subtilisin family serine protease